MKYRALHAQDEIRLLDLHPGIDGDPIRCTVRHVRLCQKPEYAAVSYVWGDPEDVIQIICNDSLVMVTRNIYAFLDSFRDENDCYSIWVDAVCIDQSNIQERNSQVQLMNQIYSQASAVISWLGEAPAQIAEVITLVNTIANIESTNSTATKVDSSVDMADKLPKKINSVWQHLSVLLGRPYARRVWVGG